MNIKADEAKSVHKHQSHSCASDCSCHSQEPLTISSEEKSVLLELKQHKQLPISRFIMSSSKEKEANFVCLAPVYIKALDDSMETVKQIGAILSGLENKGLISLNYDIDMQGYDYTQHTNSALFAYFTETVKEAKGKPKFLCDTAEIEFGTMSLTELGSSQSL